VVRPAIARERIDHQMTADVGQSAEQVHAAHILVDTKDLADAIYADVAAGTLSFEQAAIDQSVDTATAPNGGDLGWFTRGQMVDQFEQVAFTTAPGQISVPFETEFGWHIVKVIDHAADRAMTDDQIAQVRNARIDDWLAGKKATLSIESDIEPTPTPAVPESFVPPPDAPPPPTPTAVPTEAPTASPVVNAQASPVASPVGPMASPIVSPAASPVP
jgi:peptidyl-prolyl cis-trans isomerase C